MTEAQKLELILHLSHCQKCRLRAYGSYKRRHGMPAPLNRRGSLVLRVRHWLGLDGVRGS